MVLFSSSKYTYILINQTINYECILYEISKKFKPLLCVYNNRKTFHSRISLTVFICVLIGYILRYYYNILYYVYLQTIYRYTGSYLFSEKDNKVEKNLIDRSNNSMTYCEEMKYVRHNIIFIYKRHKG